MGRSPGSEAAPFTCPPRQRVSRACLWVSRACLWVSCACLWVSCALPTATARLAGPPRPTPLAIAGAKLPTQPQSRQLVHANYGLAHGNYGLTH